MTRYLVIACVVVVLSAGIGGSALAQDGPDIPCEGCPEFGSRALPQTGIWYNPEQSGTGFMMEVQGERVAGYYYLYSESGDPEWLLFNGVLEPAQGSDATWILEADLTRYRDGACLGCAFEAPVVDGVQGHVRFEFMQRNLARVQVDDGPAQRIWTITFGLNAAPHFAPTTDYPVPRLDGYWSLSVTDEGNMVYSRGMQLMEVQSSSEESFTVWLVGLSEPSPIPTPPPSPRIGELQCSESDEFQGPICKVELDDTPEHTFVMPLGNIGAGRFQAESDSGLVLHAHQVVVD